MDPAFYHISCPTLFIDQPHFFDFYFSGKAQKKGTEKRKLEKEKFLEA